MAQMQEVRVRYTFVSGAVLSAFMSVLSFSGCALEGATTEPEDELAVGETKEYLFQGDPDTVFVEAVTAMGSGCPDWSSYSTDISLDQLTFTTTFNQYLAEVAPGDNRDDKFCNLQIHLHVPNGISVAIGKFFFINFLDLQQGTSASQRALYWYQGTAPSTGVSFSKNTLGPNSGFSIFQNTVPQANLEFSQCGAPRTLNVTTRIGVKNNQAMTRSALIETQTFDGNYELQVVWNFIPC